MATIIKPHLQNAYHTGGKEAFDELSSGPFDQLNKLAADYAAERAAELVGMKYDADGNLVVNPDAEYAITDWTRERVRVAIERAFREGKSPQQLADELESSFDFSESRAERIARTELAFAQTAGSLEGWRASGEVEGKQWLLSSNHPMDDECDDNADDGVIGIDDTFSSGDDASPAHPACECDVIAILAGEEGSDEE